MGNSPLSVSRFLYNQNPFYLISAGLVLYGVQNYLALQTDQVGGHWWLAGLLMGYVAILAIVGFLIVHFGGVWDDARSIFLVLLLLFAAISVSFDQLCVTSFSNASLMLGLGFAFALLVSESLLLGLRIKLPSKFRIPFYLILLLWFGYPLLISANTHFNLGVDTRWVLYSFSVIAGLALLSLIPAIQCGRDYVFKNGTPWVWPLYPWSIFVLMVIGLCGRSWLLCMSFDISTGASSIWSHYFLIPIFLAVVTLMFEVGYQEKVRGLQWGSLVVALFGLLMAYPVSFRGAQQTFLFELTQLGLTPLVTAWVAISILYLTAWLRRIDEKAIFLSLSLLLGMFISNRSVGFATPLNAAPLIAFALLQFHLAFRHANGMRFLAGGAACAGVCALLTGQFGTDVAVATGIHILLTTLLLAGVFFNDQFAQQVRVFGSVSVVLVALAASVGAVCDVLPPRLAAAEIGGLGLVSFAVWKLARDRLFAFAMGGAAICGMLPLSLTLFGQSQFSSLNMFRFLAAGIACLVVGLFISCLKAGLAPVLNRQVRTTLEDVSRRFRRLRASKLDKPVSPQPPVHSRQT